MQECKKKAGTDEVIEYVDDGYSGEFLERPALTKLRNDVKSGHISKVICYDPDRLSRKLMNALIIDDEFRSKGVDVVYVNGEYADSPEGKLFYSLRGAISEFEKAKINERMSSGRKRKAKEGKIVKNSGIYGYNYDKEQGMYTINESEARIIKLIFHKFLVEQVGMNTIAKYLTAQGIKTKTGKDVWHRQTVRQMLMNESYTGKYYQNKWNTEGMLKNKYTSDPNEKVQMTLRDESEWIPIDIPAIITEEEYNQAAEYLKESRRRYAKASVNQYLLSGILRCQKCGNTIVGTKARWWGEPYFMYTDRKNHAGAKHKGCGLQIKMETLDNAVWGEVKNLIYNPELLNDYQDKQDISMEIKQAEHLRKEIKKAQQGRERLYSLFAMGDDLNVEEIKKQIVSLQEKENNLQTELGIIENQINLTNKNIDIESFKKAVEEYVNKDKFTFDDKKHLIRMLVKQVTVIDKDNIRLDLF